MEGWIVRRAAAVGLGAVWWWAAIRWAVAPDAGVLEGAVAAGGWGLSLLPVHCVARARAAGAVAAGRWGAAWRAGSARAGAGASSAGARAGAGASSAGAGAAAGKEAGPGVGARPGAGDQAGVTRAWPRRRSGGGSGPS
ncbi:hypothetical protein OG412_28875 [Streptomyces antibioticus]|nr:hypothetical protein [Streptomyces antibioticus]MCX4742642.1 hypothetical protein [Streptomyces antibioticus]